jgi:hypothetical protein
LTINAGGITAAGNDTDEDINVTGAALATVTVNGTAKVAADNINAAGASTVSLDLADTSAFNVVTTSTAATLNIDGAGALTLGVLDDGFTSVAAGTHSGGVTFTVAVASPELVATLGTGNDTVTTDDDGFTAANAFAINAGGGTDTLILAAAADLDTAAESARYTNFETIQTANSLDMDLVTFATALNVDTASSKVYNDMSATMGNAVTAVGHQTSATFALKTATGTNDVLDLTMGTGLTTSVATNLVTGVVVNGFETLNYAENGGATATAGANRTSTIAAITGTSLNDINLTGRAVTIGNLATTVAVDIDGSALTGNGNTGTNIQGLTVSGSAVAGSVITGSDLQDSMTVGAEGSTYNGGAGNDVFSATMALINADGTTDLNLNGGTGTDTLTLTNTTGLTMTDTHFTNISNMEGLTLTNTGAADTVITAASAFNSAFSTGAVITSGNIAATKDITLNAGLATVDVTLAIAATTQTGAATEINTIVTGSGADTITYTDVGFVGVAGAAQGAINIDTNAGDDTITVTTGTLLGNGSSVAVPIVIAGGSGQDSITMTHTNSNFAFGVARYDFAAGDSNTVTYDTITGINVAAAALFSDQINVEGTGTVGAFTATVDSGTILSHDTTAGVITFDDAGTFAAAITINAANLADVVGYLGTNAAANESHVFTFDSTGDGTADGSMVHHQGSAAGVADDLIFLAGVTTIDAIIVANANGANDIFIL